MSDRAANTRRRANWVGLRTLRQRPKVVGETEEGEPIFEVRSVRLVLGDDVSHFNRILACARCGREVFGMPVLRPADLDHPPSSVICKECVRAAGPSSFWNASRTAGGPLRAGAASSTMTTAAVEVAAGLRPGEVTLSAPAEARPGPAIVPAEGVVDLGRFSAFQSRVEERLTRLTELLEIRSKEVEAAVDERLDETQSKVDAVTAGQGQLAAALERVEHRVNDLTVPRAAAARVEELTVARAELTSRMADMADRLAERIRILEEAAQRVPAAVEGLVGVQAQLNDRMDRSSERAARQATAASAVEERVQAAPERVAGLEERMARGALTLAELVRSRDELTLRLADLAAGMARAGETQRAELRGEVRYEVAAIQDQLNRRVDDLAERARHAAEDERVRHDGLERQTTELVELQAALDSGLGELRAELVALAKAGGPGGRGLSEGLDALEGIEERDGTRRRPFGRGSAEASAALASLSDLVQRLAWRHDQLEMRMGMVEEAGDQATGAVGRQLSALRKEVKAQSKALDALSQTVESLPRPKSTRARKA